MGTGIVSSILSLCSICLTGKAKSTNGACKVPVCSTRWRKLKKKKKVPSPVADTTTTPKQGKFRFSVGNLVSEVHTTGYNLYVSNTRPLKIFSTLMFCDIYHSASPASQRGNLGHREYEIYSKLCLN